MKLINERDFVQTCLSSVVGAEFRIEDKTLRFREIHLIEQVGIN